MSVELFCRPKPISKLIFVTIPPGKCNTPTDIFLISDNRVIKMAKNEKPKKKSAAQVVSETHQKGWQQSERVLDFNSVSGIYGRKNNKR